MIRINTFTKGDTLNIQPLGQLNNQIVEKVLPRPANDARYKRLNRLFGLFARGDVPNRSLQLFGNLERIDRVIRQTTDIEQMMSDILQATLGMFETDRCWLLYPCDPCAESWNVPMERTRPEYPSAPALGEEVPMLPEVEVIFRGALDKDGVITVDSRDADALKETHERFSILAQMHMAVYPQTGKPWLFGMHQCSFSRDWTDEEKKLFRIVACSTFLPFKSIAVSHTSAENSVPSICLCIHSNWFFPCLKAAAICSFARLIEAVPQGCTGGESSEGCLFNNSSRDLQPKICKAASLQSKNALSSSSMIASLVDLNSV